MHLKFFSVVIAKPSDPQYLIAAKAISREFTLVSNITNEFIHIPNLKLENWI